MSGTAWEPPAELSREEIIALSNHLLAQPDIPYRVTEDIFRLHVLEMDWDVGGNLFEPEDPGQIPVGADGRKAGIFLLHGGGGDHRSLEPMARILVGKFGYKVFAMAYPGHLYLLDPSRDWPGDTINPDGSVRVPIWCTDSRITPDQYELVQDRSDPEIRAKYGTLFFLKAREGTEFYDRMAAWPVAFEEAMKAVCARHFPSGEFSIYAHGHSTGGPFAHLLLQRVDNVVGLVGVETSPFGSIFGRMQNAKWPYPFNYLTVRTWRDIARYYGHEAGPEGCKRLPWLMEDVFEEWERRKRLSGLKAQQLVQFGLVETLEQAARHTARRLGLSAAETEALVQRYRGYPSPLSGPGVKPVPPLLYGIASGSRDHTPERYRGILFPALEALNPPPKKRLVYYHAGVHTYHKPEPDLPRGIAPAAAHVWHQAITQGYYVES